jgi:uncharacterized protein YeaO (DUF488 family)
MIKTKSIYDPKENSDATRILITRQNLRFIKKERYDEGIIDLSPDWDAVKNGKRVKGLSWIGKDLRKNSFDK